MHAGMIQETFPMTLGEDEILSERLLLSEQEGGMFMSGPQAVRWIILHCSATRENRNYSVEQMLRDHKARGFRTIGYHFYIRRDGTLTQHRNILEVGAHCRPFNRCSIGICYEGGLDCKGNPKDTRTAFQREQLLMLLTRLKKMFPDSRIRGHCEMPDATPKSCPCFSSKEYRYLDSVRIE